MAPLAERLVAARLDRVPAQEIGAMNEIPIHAVGEHDFDRKWHRLGVTILAKGLVMAMAAGRGG